MRAIELHPAAVWYCPACGKENFETMIAGHRVHGMNRVECRHCESEFATSTDANGENDPEHGAEAAS